MTRTELDPWLEGYLSYQLEVRKLSHRTIADLRCTLKKVAREMEAQQPGTPLWKLRLEDYLHWLNDKRDEGRRPNVLAKDLSHLRGLLDYAWRSGRSDRNVLDGFSLHDGLRKEEPRSLTLAEAARLVQSCPRQTAGERRSRLIILLLYGCGLRTAELCDLDVQDVTVERQELLVKHGKGGYQRTIPVPAAVWTELLAYVAEGHHKRGPLFRTAAKQARIHQKDVGDIVRLAAERAAVPDKVTPRTLRHSFGTHLMDAGVDVAVIASLMGHRSPSETSIYLHVLPGKPRAAVDALVPATEVEP